MLVNDEQLTWRAQRLLSGSGAVIAPELRSCGADDFAYYAQRHPGLIDEPAYHSGRTSASLHQPSFYLGVVLSDLGRPGWPGRFPSRACAVGRTGLNGRPVPVEQDGSAGSALLLLAEQLIEPFGASRG